MCSGISTNIDWKGVINIKSLMDAALAARKKAYVPYSQFAVGAALLTVSGQIMTGCNIENASYGLANCAERTAFFRAIAEGEQTFQALAVVADTAEPVSPCGACRQVMAEFCPPDFPVYLGNLEGRILETTVAELLPYAFDQEAFDGEHED